MMIVQSQQKRPWISSSLLLVAILLSARSVIVESVTFTIHVDSGTETCLALPTPPGQEGTISGSFELIDEEEELSAKPLKVIIYNPQKQPVYTSPENTPHGRFHTAGNGKYRLCVENGGSNTNPREARKADGETRQIGLAIRVKGDLLHQVNEYEKNNNNNNKPNTADNRNTLSIEERRHLQWESDQETEKIKRTEKIVKLTDDLSDKIDELMDHLSYLKVRHVKHEDVSMMTFSRIMRWNLVQGLALVCMSVGQIMAIRKAVEKRRFM